MCFPSTHIHRGNRSGCISLGNRPPSSTAAAKSIRTPPSRKRCPFTVFRPHPWHARQWRSVRSRSLPAVWWASFERARLGLQARWWEFAPSSLWFPPFLSFESFVLLRLSNAPGCHWERIGPDGKGPTLSCP